MREAPQNRIRGLTILLILSAIMVLVTLLRSPIVWRGLDQAVQIPIILHYQDGSLYQNDYLLSALPQYSTYFFKGIALLGLDLEGIFNLNLWGTILSLFLFYSMYIFLCRQLSDRWDVTLLSALGLAVGLMPTMAIYAIPTYFTHALFALPLLVLCMLLLIKEKPIWAGGILGACANLHAMHAFILAVPLVVFLLLNLKRFGWLKSVGALSAFGVVALPVFIHKISLPTQGFDLQLWVEILRARSPFHIFPFSISPGRWLPFLAFFSAFGLSFFILNGKITESPKNRLLLSLGISTVGLFIISILFTEIAPWRPILELQPLRVSLFLYLAALPLIIKPLALTICEGKNTLHQLADVCILALLLSAEMSLVVLGAGLLCIDIILRRAGAQSCIKALAIFALLSCVIALLVTFMGQLTLFGFQYEVKIPPSTLAILLLLPLATVLAAKRLPLRLLRAKRWAPFTALVIAVLVGGFWGFSGFAEGPDEDWSAIQEKASRLVPKQEVIMVPPSSCGFRIGSGRAIYGDWKDGTLGNFDPPFAFEWWERMVYLQATAGWQTTEDEQGAGYGSLSPQEVLARARELNITFVVTLAGALGQAGELACEGRYSLYNTELTENTVR